MIVFEDIKDKYSERANETLILWRHCIIDNEEMIYKLKKILNDFSCDLAVIEVQNILNS